MNKIVQFNVFSKCFSRIANVIIFKRLLFLFVLISVNSWLHSVIITVNQDGSGDFTTIWDGIQAATENDTVHVFPGTYFEALFIDKNLSLVSNYEFSNDESDIASTILDGSVNGWSIIRAFGEEEDWIDVYICGFTIQNGEGYPLYSTGRCGGGLISEYGNIFLKKNVIQKNRATSGGGLYLINTNTDFIGNTIKNNHAYKSAGGIFLGSTDINFDSDNLNNIYLNYAAKGADIYRVYDCPPIEVIVDTFTISEPDFFSIYSLNVLHQGYYSHDEITYNIQNAKIEQVEHDLYVSADGDDTNSGLTPAEPLQNIHYAVTLIKADSLNPRTIYVADGIYSPSLNNQYFPLHMKSYVSIVGESRENTIIDAEGGEGFIYANDILEDDTEFLQRDWSVKNFTMKNSENVTTVYAQKNHNVYLENIEITECSNYDLMRSYKTKIDMDKITFQNCTNCSGYKFSGSNGYDVNFTNFLIDNIAQGQGDGIAAGITITKNPFSQPDHTVNIVNANITHNISYMTSWPYAASAVYCSEYSKTNLINCTITENESNTGGAVKVSYESEMNMYNSILYGDDPREICLDGSNGHINNISIHNSLIEGGEDGIQSVGNNNIYWDVDTNLDENPLFIGDGDYPFTLSQFSPCIDSGTLDLPEGIVLPAYDLAGNLRICGAGIDMGAYEWQDIVAPVNVVADSVAGIIAWSIPEGNFPTEYRIYLDGFLQTTISNEIMEYTFPELSNGVAYISGVSAVYNGAETAIISTRFVYSPVGVEENVLVAYNKISNFPNPFNPSTTISFSLDENTKHAEVKIYNIKGQLVNTMMNAYVSEGNYNLIWEGKDENSHQVSSGTYLYKLIVNGKEAACEKMTLVK